jgi:hypothetical protein
MSTRFVSNLLLVLAGVVVIVATQAFAPPTVRWIAFGVTGVGVLVLMRRPRSHPGGVACSGRSTASPPPLAAWTIVENLVFSGTLMAWLTFGAAAGIVAIGVAGLIAHELSTERVVHSLEDVRSADRHMEALA